MRIPSETRLAALLEPYFVEAPFQGAALCTVASNASLYAPLGRYLDLLLRWNERTNLTAIREPEEIVSRHFGESLFAGQQLAQRVRDGAAVLDFGSGAGFPGLPIQLLLPHLRVTLAESQGKKAAFLREVVRVLGVPAIVWAGRVEEMSSEMRFDAVMLRAVDNMGTAVRQARLRVQPEGWLMEMRAGEVRDEQDEKMPGLLSGSVHFEQGP